MCATKRKKKCYVNSDGPLILTEMTKKAQNLYKPCDSLSEGPNRPTKDGGSNQGHWGHVLGNISANV